METAEYTSTLCIQENGKPDMSHEENLDIVYTRSRNKLVEVPIQENDFIELGKIIDDIVAIIQKCRYPKPTKY